jgi:hypothetical protein
MTDELEQRLAAWLDGAMTDAEAAEFEQLLESDPQLAERAANWKANDQFIAGAFAPVADQAIDPTMLARLGLAEVPMPVAANDNPPWWRGRGFAMGGGAIAAGLALAMVLLGQGGNPARPDELSLALDTTPSLETARLADGRTIQPRLTVQAKDGRWCREYVSGDQDALACRGDNGWEVIGTGKAAPQQASGGNVALAGGEDGAALDTAFAQIEASDPLGAQAEAELIKAKWQRR